MNQLRSNPRTHPSVFFVVVLAALVATSGGVLYAYYKNRQIQTVRAIEVVEKRIEQHELDIRTAQMRSDQLLNRYTIRERLRHVGSDLRPIPHGVVEEIGPHNPTAGAVASAMP
jgi:hypothetical protein